MVAKVVTIESVLNPDNLARELVGLYERWRLQKIEKESEWKELRNYLFATDTRTTTNAGLPWKNSTTIPKITQIRDNLHANYMDALFPNDNWLFWEGDDIDSVTKEKKQALETYIMNKARLSGFLETMDTCLQDYIDYGNAFCEVHWIRDVHVDPISGLEDPTYIGPKAVRVSPYDIVFNPAAASFGDSPKFTRYVKSVGELQKEMKYRTDLQFVPAIMKKAMANRKNYSSFRMEDQNKAEGYLADGFGTLSEYYGSGLVEIIEFEGDYYDKDKDELYENQIITIIDRCYILRNIENPSWLGKDSKVHVGWRERPDNLYAMGPLDNLVGMQYRLDHLENLKADALDFTIMPPLKIVGDVEPFEWKPGESIHVPEDGDVVPMPPNAAAFQVNNEIAYLMQMMEELAGAPKQAMGIRTPGEKTAFEVQTLENSSARIFYNKINKFEREFMEPLLNKMLEVAKRNMDTTDITRVFDTDLGSVDFINVTREDITAKGKLRPVGARHYAARAQLMQNLMQVFNSPMSQFIAPHISSVNTAALVEEVLGLRKYQLIKPNVAIAEQAQTKRLADQASATNEAEQAVPLEEGLIGQAGIQ